MIRRATHHHTGFLYLQIHGHEEELDAVYEIMTETYPAEPYPWGQGRGTETEVSAKLICWVRHGETYSRDDAEGICGEAEIIRQEGIAAEDWASDHPGPALRDDYGDWLRDRQMDRVAMAAE